MKYLTYSLMALVMVAGSVAAAEKAPTMPPNDSAVPGVRHLFRVTLHTPMEIEGLLARAEQLARNMRPTDRRNGIALVLHGPEVEIFARKNYTKYRHIVDRAARLSAEKVIEIKMCQTEMRSRDIRDEDVPKFIEFVPYGPDEEDRLQRRGYVYL